MVVVIGKKHLSLNNRLSKESNALIKQFNNKNYSKVENVDGMLNRRDTSVEKKKKVLIKKLHEAVVKAFSINKKKFNRKSLESLKKRAHNLRKITIKLRSINYYLETTFLEDLNLSRTKISGKKRGSRQGNDLARDQLEVLEYTAYKLIGEVVMLDKKLLSEYGHKEKNIVAREKVEVKNLHAILRKESMLMEHLEAKLPPPKAISMSLVKEPTFTHWIARVFALLSYLEHMYAKETEIFGKLKKNKATKAKISKKIIHLIKERSSLINIMEQKRSSMKKFRIDGQLKKELRNLTTTITV